MAERIEKDILILTKSAKYHKYCVAGIELSGENRFIRLVKGEEGPLSDDDLKCSEEDYIKPYDVARVALLKQANCFTQPENWTVLDGEKIKKISSHEYKGKLKEAFLNSISQDELIFGNDKPYIVLKDGQQVQGSLAILRAYNIKIYTITTSKEQKKTKCDFTVGDTRHYGYSITEPDYFNADKEIDNAFLVVSLGAKPLNNNQYYKFIAKIIPTRSLVYQYFPKDISVYEFKKETTVIPRFSYSKPQGFIMKHRVYPKIFQWKKLGITVCGAFLRINKDIMAKIIKEDMANNLVQSQNLMKAEKGYIRLFSNRQEERFEKISDDFFANVSGANTVATIMQVLFQYYGLKKGDLRLYYYPKENSAE